MIDRIVSFALTQRFMVIVAMAGLLGWGVLSFQNLPIDAYPDLAIPARVIAIMNLSAGAIRAALKAESE